MPNTKDLHIERFLPARPLRAWMAWTEPDMVAKWFSPFPKGTAKVGEWDVATGGKGSATVVDPDGGGEPLTFLANFKKVTPSKEIVFTMRDDRDHQEESPEMTVRFEPEEGGEETKMIFDSPAIPESDFDGASAGWQAFFDKLEDALSAGDSGDLLFEGGEGMRIGDPNSDE
jgi:uncharacterized protein YndB with AHSA1/START domain